MGIAHRSIVLFLTCAVAFSTLPAHAKAHERGFEVQDVGGSLDARTGDKLVLLITGTHITISRLSLVHENPNYQSWVHKEQKLVIDLTPLQVTGLSYGSESHHRVGTGIAVGIISLGGGLIVAATKEKKHYIGLTWDTGTEKGGVAMRVDKNEFRGIIAALEGVTGKKCVDTDQTVARKLGVEP